MMIPMGRTSRAGAPRGTRMRGREATFDPESGKPYIAGATFSDPDEAIKLVRAAAAAKTSVAEILRQAVLHMPVDADGCPTWWPKASDQLGLDLESDQQQRAA